MDNNWIVENLTNAFGVWNSKMTEMWSLLTESPQTFKGGTIWQTIVTINGGMQAIGYGLLVLFFAIGIFRSASSFRDFQRPEHLLRHFIYFVLAKLGITYGILSFCFRPYQAHNKAQQPRRFSSRLLCYSANFCRYARGESPVLALKLRL